MRPALARNLLLLFLLLFPATLFASEAPGQATDRQAAFAHGSGISLTSLTSAQTRNLAMLGRVWGFLKYHHPGVVAGEFDWDQELFRILPSVLAAKDQPAVNAVFSSWMVRMGEVKPCQACATLNESDLQQHPDLKWIEDSDLLGSELSTQLVNIYKNRPNTGKQFYVSLAPDHNVVLKNEPSYKDAQFPDAGLQILAAYRFWNAVEYWSPARDVSGEDWPRVLEDSIAGIALAKTKDEYQLRLMAMVARLHDGHANLLSSINVRPPVGECRLPVQVRFVENVPVIFRLDDDAGEQLLSVGDVIAQVEHVPVSRLMAEWKPYFGVSNEAGLFAETARYLTRGACGDVNITVRRGHKYLSLNVPRLASAKRFPLFSHDRAGDAFQMLSPAVAYLKLSTAKAADSANYIRSAVDAKGLIIDIRGYPADFLAFDLGSHLVSKETPFARATEPDLNNPGAFHFTDPVTIPPAFPLLRGKVIILVDEAAMSSAEFQAMAFRAVPGAIVVGSMTAGADGNVSQIPLPGGLFTLMSGLGVFYPDKRPTQRIGIIPDITAKPTLQGIQAGGDEVLETAIKQISER